MRQTKLQHTLHRNRREHSTVPRNCVREREAREMIGQSYETTQTLDADALADHCFLEESWTLGVPTALKNRQQRLQFA